MTPTEQDKELRAYIAECFGMDKHEDWYDSYRYNDREKMLNYITADRKRVALEARIDELSGIFRIVDGRIFWQAETSLAVPIEERIAELKAQQEEV